MAPSKRLGYKVFKRGDRVVRVETGQAGTVGRQFTDGYVMLSYDDGRLAELPASILEIEGDQPKARGASR